MIEHISGLEQLQLTWVHFVDFLTITLATLQIPLPVGILGVWRWGVWLFRRFIGLFYYPQEPTGYMTTTTVITPVYNEVPHVFQAALRSWAANQPTEIIAVIDHSDEKSIEIFHEFEEECKLLGIIARLIVTKKPGKRPALADGILAAACDIVCLVDSDTIWAEDVLVNVVAPFEDPEVGGVTTRQNVLNPQTVAQRIFDVYLDIRYEDEVRFLTAFPNTPFGDAVTCLSGRTAVYRRAAVLPVVDELMNETFLGKPVISGDDKALTLLVQGRYWKVRYQENAQVYTPGAAELKVFLKQRLRWARNSWRADLKALCSRWVWRKPLLAVHLMDRLLQPLTTIVAPLYVSFAIFRQHWVGALVVVSWWCISRSIKLWPHLRHRWQNITILPWYIFFNYWSAVMRIYAFFTMNQQGWITRWSKSRMAMLGPLGMLPAYAGTVATVAMVATFVVFRGLSAEVSAQALLPDPFAIVISTANSMPLANEIQASSARQDTMQLLSNNIGNIGNINNSIGVLDGEAGVWSLVFSPDGRQIVFVSSQLGVLKFFVRDSASGQLRPLLPGVKAKFMPVWSPDSRKIAFVVDSYKAIEVQTVDVYTAETRSWVPLYQQGVYKDFVWSQDSKTIILDFVSAQAEQSTERALAIKQPMTGVGQIAPTLGPAPEPDEARSLTQTLPLSNSISITQPTKVVIVTPSIRAAVDAVALPLTAEPALPTATESPTVAASPTATLFVPTFVGTPSFYLVTTILADHAVNARYAANIDSAVLLVVAPPTMLYAVGRTSDNSWLRVILPDQRLAWVASEVVVVDWSYIAELPVLD